MEDEIRTKGIIITKSQFKIGSRNVFINSGEVHYFRIPPDEWEDRLTKIKTLGINTISTYVFWNYHEENEGKFDITSPAKDLDHFMHLCENKGLYVIIRPGPWIGSDLLNGGIPNWIIEEHPKIMSQDENYNYVNWSSKEEPPVSYLSPTYLHLIERYFERLSDVLRRHLYPHGGLILLQIDNELSFQSKKGLFEVDYNPVAIDFYKKFLKGKYHEIEEVNKNYSQNFLSFDHIEPPNSKTQEGAMDSQNEFKCMGEFLRNMDWMEFKERILQEYIGTISYFLRNKGIYLPYFVNVPALESPVNIKSFYDAYKTKILVGLDIGETFLSNLEETQEILEARIEILKTQVPLISFVPEVHINSPDKVIPPNYAHLLIRLLLGHGIQGLNYYMGVGGKTPKLVTEGKSYSILKKSVEYNGESLIVGKDDTSYDCGAPIGMGGQKNPLYEVIELASKFLKANGERLLGAEKVHDNDIVILYYHPYSRLNFNTSKFGLITDFQQCSKTNTYPAFNLFHKIGFHPLWRDLQQVTLDELKNHKIIVVMFSAFLDQESMFLLKKYVEGGGIIVSFYDIPVRNEKMKHDDTLSNLYKTEILKRDNPKSISIKDEKFASYSLIYEFKMNEMVKNASEIYQNDIIASDTYKNPKKIYAFHRSVNDGHIYHFGFVPSSDEKGLQYFEEFLRNIKISPKKTEHPKELTVLRLKCENKEEFVTVANLTKNNLENIEVSLHDVENNDAENSLVLKDLTVVGRSSIQWSINKEINEYTCVKACTSELNDVQRRVNKDFITYTVSGIHFRGSRNILEVNFKQKPVKVISGNKDITKRVFQSDNKLRVQFTEIKSSDERLYKISAIYSDDLHLLLHFDGSEKKEIVDFNIQRKNSFID